MISIRPTQALAADAALLHAAERCDLAKGLGEDDAFVNADDAVFERLSDAPDAADVAAVEIGGKGLASLPRERGKVRVGVSLAIFMAPPSSLKRYIGQNGRLEEAAALRAVRAADNGSRVSDQYLIAVDLGTRLWGKLYFEVCGPEP